MPRLSDERNQRWQAHERHNAEFWAKIEAKYAKNRKRHAECRLCGDMVTAIAPEDVFDALHRHEQAHPEYEEWGALGKEWPLTELSDVLHDHDCVFVQCACACGCQISFCTAGLPVEERSKPAICTLCELYQGRGHEEHHLKERITNMEKVSPRRALAGGKQVERPLQPIANRKHRPRQSRLPVRDRRGKMDRLTDKVAAIIHEWHCPDESGWEFAYLWTGPTQNAYVECAEKVFAALTGVTDEELVLTAEEIRQANQSGMDSFAHASRVPVCVAKSQRGGSMRCFVMYRKGDLSATHDANQVNPPDEPQFEGVVFSDGTVAVRWLTARRSTSVWVSLDDLLAIHGHPVYKSELVWL